MGESSRSLEGKVAIVTGGGRGIGRAVAAALAREGARVCVSARSAHELDESVAQIHAAGGEAMRVSCDITDRAAVDQMVAGTFAAYGRLDVVVNNAGEVASEPRSSRVTPRSGCGGWSSTSSEPITSAAPPFL